MVSVTFLLQYLYGGERKIVSLIEITIQKDLLNSPFSQGAGRGGRVGMGHYFCDFALAVFFVTSAVPQNSSSPPTLSPRPPLDNALLIFFFKESLEMCLKYSAVDQINLLPLWNYNF